MHLRRAGGAALHVLSDGAAFHRGGRAGKLRGLARGAARTGEPPSNELMTSKACIFAEQAAPRYTSYPTAPHFTAAVGPETYAGWLEELPEQRRLALYLHVPFCG